MSELKRRSPALTCSREAKTMPRTAPALSSEEVVSRERGFGQPLIRPWTQSGRKNRKQKRLHFLPVSSCSYFSRRTSYCKKEILNWLNMLQLLVALIDRVNCRSMKKRLAALRAIMYKIQTVDPLLWCLVTRPPNVKTGQCVVRALHCWLTPAFTQNMLQWK